jgi:hypothetical protein
LCPSRQKDGGRWYEPQVALREDFDYRYSPWPTARPESFEDPGFDVSRFDLDYWRKFERLLRQARDLGIVVQVIFFTDAQEPYNYPFDRERVGDDPNERRYYAYAAARFAAFANVEWCITNEWRLFRPDEWVDIIGAFLTEKDPYGHLCSVHGHGDFPFRTSPWCTHALYQVWDEDGAYGFMREQREDQLATGRPMPQVNEEYGYEDHYPGPWGGGRVAPARNGDSRRRLAWEIAMAGCHQTTGESAANGLGGWINGLGDETMTMFEGYRHLKTFFESFDWRALEPTDGVASGGARCLTGDDILVVYMPEGSTEVTLPDGRWEATTYDPQTGIWGAPGKATSGSLEMQADGGDTACLLRRL